MRYVLAAPILLASLVGIMAIAIVSRANDWSPFATAVAAWVVGILASIIVIAATRERWTSAQLARRLAGSGVWDFSVRWVDQPPAYRDVTIDKAADLLDLLEDAPGAPRLEEFYPVLPEREALASALFAQYGSVRQGEFRNREEWLDDASKVIDYARRFPRG